MKRILILLTILCLAICSCAAADSSAPADTAKPEEQESFHYVHDPRENPAAMRDIVVNPKAVYGFSPSTAEGSTLKQYADLIDWTDPAQVAEARKQRQEYHESLQELYEMIMDMVKENKDTETIARAVSRRRNELRLEASAANPDELAILKERNMETYGNEFGPTPESLYEKYGSWDMVLLKALGTNAGMDACLGSYDEYYYLYDIGQEEAESSLPADSGK